MAQSGILIVGGGIAGLTLAAALRQRGFQVDLIEQKSALSDGGGIGLTLVGNALRALDQIGVAEACVEAGMPADSMAICRPDGTIVAENPLPRIGGPQWPGGTGIRRAALHAILVEAARGAGVSIRCDTTMSDWSDRGDDVEVTFSDGSRSCYALVVGADGLYSATREKLMPQLRPALTGQVVWRAEAARPPEVRRTHLHLGGPHGVVGICPVSEELAYVYIVAAAPDNPWRDPATLHLQMREALTGYGGLVAELAETLDRSEKVSYRPLEWLMAPRPWGRGRVVLIGDAVHANPPVLAQGAAMAIEDAIVLADELVQSGGAADVALPRFLDRRFDRSAAVVEASCALARAEVEHRQDLDVPAVMRAATLMLAEAI